MTSFRSFLKENDSALDEALVTLSVLPKDVVTALRYSNYSNEIGELGDNMKIEKIDLDKKGGELNKIADEFVKDNEASLIFYRTILYLEGDNKENLGIYEKDVAKWKSTKWVPLRNNKKLNVKQKSIEVAGSFDNYQDLKSQLKNYSGTITGYIMGPDRVKIEKAKEKYFEHLEKFGTTLDGEIEFKFERTMVEKILHKKVEDNTNIIRNAILKILKELEHTTLQDNFISIASSKMYAKVRASLEPLINTASSLSYKIVDFKAEYYRARDIKEILITLEDINHIVINLEKN